MKQMHAHTSDNSIPSICGQTVVCFAYNQHMFFSWCIHIANNISSSRCRCRRKIIRCFKPSTMFQTAYEKQKQRNASVVSRMRTTKNIQTQRKKKIALKMAFVHRFAGYYHIDTKANQTRSTKKYINK